MRQLVINEVAPHLSEMVRAQIKNAKGLDHFFLRDEAGRFVQVMDPKMIETALNAGEKDSYYWIHTKDPSTPAFTDLANRVLDKPKEQEQEVKLSGGLKIQHELPE